MPLNLLSSTLDNVTIKAILSRHPRTPLLPPLGDKRWENVKKKPAAARWIETLRSKAGEECHTPLPELTDALYADFALTGRRLPFESVYFERRRRLARAAISLLFCEQEDSAKDRLVSSVISKLTSILDEASWALPAHVSADATGKDSHQIDLFCAETANLMAEMLDLVGALLPVSLTERIHNRLSSIFRDYLDKPYPWKKTTDNWNAVCHQGVIGAALSQLDDVELLTQMLMACREFLPSFLSGYGPDGGSTEGPGYWEYGFGWFATLNQQLEIRTGGELSLFEDNSHVLEIARFGPRVLLSGSNIVNFADTNRTGGLDPWLLAYLGNRLDEPDCTTSALQEYRRVAAAGIKLDQERADLFHFIRLFLCCPDNLASEVPPKKDHFFPDLGVIVAHGADASGHCWDFAAKAGHNGEHHNHNDCGNFILNIDGIQLITEIGAPEYVADFFSPKRYEFLAARTLGHSLPIINGCEQADGAERASKVIAHTLSGDAASLVIDVTACYPQEAGCKKHVRTFHFEKKQGRLIVEDQFKLKRADSLESGIISIHPITLQGNRAIIKADHLTLGLDALPGTHFARVDAHSYRDHDGSPAQIHRLVLIPDALASQTRLGLSIALSTPKKAAFFGNQEEKITLVYGHGRRQKIEALTSCFPEIVTRENFAQHAPHLRDIEVIFGTWGMPCLTDEMLDHMPKLRAVFYAAGTVRPLIGTTLDRGIQVFSAWQANAIPVAEFTVAQILLSNKGYFRNVEEHRRHPSEDAFTGVGNFGATVALLGAGQIGRNVIRLLRLFNIQTVVFDPFLTAESAKELGVEKVSLEEAFQKGNVVSNHLANLPATVHMIQGCHFRSMPPNATFINTGRGLTVAENEMIDVLKTRPDLTALLDVVTDEENHEANAPLFALPNVRISNHIAGSQGDEVVRMADYMIEEFLRWEQGEPLRYAVTKERLKNMA